MPQPAAHLERFDVIVVVKLGHPPIPPLPEAEPTTDLAIPV
jgi:hypothetical protein